MCSFANVETKVQLTVQHECNDRVSHFGVASGLIRNNGITSLATQLQLHPRYSIGRDPAAIKLHEASASQARVLPPLVSRAEVRLRSHLSCHDGPVGACPHKPCALSRVLAFKPTCLRACPKPRYHCVCDSAAATAKV